MTWNRVQFKDQGRVAADAEDSARWTSTTVDAMFALVFDQAWRRVLAADPVYRYTELTVVPDSDGMVTLASIQAQLGSNRFFRCIDQRTVRDKGLATIGQVVLDPVVIGSNVRFMNPQVTGNVSLWVNHLPENPQSFTGSTADTDPVTWIDGEELCLAYLLGANLLTKGAVESGAAADLFAIADQMFTEMLQSIMRRTTRLAQFTPTDNANDWNAGMSW